MSVHDYEQREKTLALLRVLDMAREDAEAGRLIPVEEAFAQARAGLRKRD